MEIFGRNVKAISYMGKRLVNAYVGLKPSDCRRNTDTQYKCLDNCEQSLVIMRYLDKNPISIKVLVPQEIEIHPQMKSMIKAQSLADLESIAKQPLYNLQNENKGKVLYYNGQTVAIYNPCGFTNKVTLASTEIQQTVQQLQQRVNEVYRIVEEKPLQAILKDQALAEQLNHPMVLTMMSTMFGQEGIDLVKQIKAMKKRH